ncbi:MAG: aminotransferase class V-fold PLP-dependent enzyme [Bacteroidetes bacterium]|nr:aminotransferase class V-fold PLP-dependent enzyme [Bacteroidota bacterium]
MLLCQRDQFSLPQGQHYLNCGFLSPLLISVERAGIETLRLKRDPTQVKPSIFFEGIHAVRQLFAKLINGESNQVALIPATSYGISTIVKNISITSDQNIVVIHEQFPSNVYAWRRLSYQTGATIHTVIHDGRDWTEKILETINDQTAVVAMETVHWTTGYCFDLQIIRQRAHEVGALFILDGTQSIGAVPFDVKTVRPDAVVCAGYKWLMGPYGTAYMYVGEHFMDGVPLEETWIARKGSDQFDGLVNYTDEYREGAFRFDRGQSSAFSQTAMMREALRQVMEWDPAQIQMYCTELLSNFLPTVKSLGYTVDQHVLPHLFGIGIPDHVCKDQLSDQLNQRRISVSQRGGSLRVSPNVYNHQEDIQALLDVLQSAVK